ncbi:MAG: hypothetical protein Q8R34_01965 [bacterium]|nr:hypothetical protein [bacterium]
MRHFNKTKKVIFLGLLLGLVIFGFSTKDVQAGWLDEQASSAVSSVILYMSNVVMALLGNALAMVAGWLGSFLKLQSGYFENLTIVENSWAVFRDFTNMFFILILIIIAFATIFDMQNYNWKGLMAKFIIAALMINFSLAIGGLFIKISTTLSNVAINSFTDITANLAGGFGLNEMITARGASATSGDLLANVVLMQVISSIGMIIMTAIVLLAFVSAFAFSVARVPVLWVLLIVSPIAWITYILPQTRGIWSKWWKWFLCWTFFMPAYLFSLVMGIAILTNRPEIQSAVDSSKGSGLASVGNFFGLGLQGIFFYILTIIIMVGSLAAAMKMACAGGTGVAKTMGFINDRVQKLTYVSALRKGAKEKLGEIQKTGLPGKLGALYGGERTEKLKEARVAQGIFRERGAVQAEKDRAMREDIKTYKERFKATTDVEELKKNMKEGPREQKLAIAELLKERGELKAEDMKGVYNLYREAGSDSNAIEFAKSIKYDKLSKTDREQLYNTLGIKNAEVAREIVGAMAEKGDWRTEEGPALTEKLQRYASLFTQEGDRGDFLNKAMKFNFEEAVQAKVNINNADSTKPKQELTQELEKTIQRMNIDKLSELSAGNLKKLMEKKETRDLISRKITPDTATALAGKLTSEQLDALKEPGQEKNMIEEKKEQFKKELAEEQEKNPMVKELREMKEILKQQGGPDGGSGGTTPPAQPRKQIGFVPPGSTISGGEVKNPENINPNNVLDLRKK